MRLSLYTLDVFTTRRFAGNPLGVVVCPEPIDAALMQSIAFEIGYAETTFLLAADVDAARAQPGRAVPVRIFTPTAELPFAGHPTVGTAWLLADRLGIAAPLSLRLGAGDVTVERELQADEVRFAFRAPEPEFVGVLDPVHAAALAGVDVGRLAADAPCSVIRGGPVFAFAPLDAVDALATLRPDLVAMRALGADHEALPCVFAFAPRAEAYAEGVAYEARMFFDAGALREDSATGSAAVALGAWLRAGGGHALPLTVTIHQGNAMGRPSELHLRLATSGIRLSGAAVPLIEGTLEL